MGYDETTERRMRVSERDVWASSSGKVRVLSLDPYLIWLWSAAPRRKDGKRFDMRYRMSKSAKRELDGYLERRAA